MKRRCDKYPNAKPYTDRHGKRRWRYRSRGFTAELGTKYGSEDFELRYQNAIMRKIGHPGAGALRTKPGTLNDLVARFYKIHFPTIEESTRADYRSVIEPLREKHGHKRVAHMRIRHVMEIKADMHATPTQANKTLKRLSQMMDLAVKLEWINSNPVKGVGHYRIYGGGYHTWDEDEIARFYAVHSIGTPAHLAMTLMLYTGASKVDAVQLSVVNLRDGRMQYRRQKTRKNPDGILIDIPIHDKLREAIAAHGERFTFLETRNGKARSSKGLGSAMRKWCDKAGLPLCSSHGLRKAICRRIAEAGGSPFEIMSVSGHITLSEAQRYCESFGRKGLADSAFEKMNRTNGEQELTNQPARFVRRSFNSLKVNDK